jgi:ribosomal protein S18 acetylase RimI-like enzyme
MDITPLLAEEAAVERYVRELWLPYHRDLASIADRHALADRSDSDLVAAETEFRLDWLDSDNHRAWVAIDDGNHRDAVAADAFGGDGSLVGFVTTEISESPPVFDRPDRLRVGDIYVREPHRGTGLARELIDRAIQQARETGCSELTLDVDVDNDRALAFYRTLGFETYRRQMVAPVGTLRETDSE